MLTFQMHHYHFNSFLILLNIFLWGSSTSLVSLISVDLPFSPVTVSQDVLRAILAKQKVRTSLQISYMLLIELKPKPKQLSTPIDSEEMYYFDLVNMICEQECAALGDGLTIELFAYEGYPLATNPSCYISKLSDWCLETYDSIILYAVPKPRLFAKIDRRSKSNNLKRLDANEVIYIQNELVGFGPIQVSVDCKNMKVIELETHLSHMTTLPVSHFNLLFKGVYIISGENTLEECKIKDKSVIEIVPVDTFWLSYDQNFHIGAYLATWNGTQSLYGKTMFFASLYSISEGIMKQPNFTTDKINNVLGHIRSMTGCAPLIHALKVLFDRQCLSLPHRVAIQELLMLVFKTIGPRQLKGDAKCFTIQENKILEESTKFWAYFIEFAKDYHGKTEDYTSFDLCCSVKKNRMREPNRVMGCQGIPHIVDKQNYNDKIEGEMFEPLPEYSRMIKSFSGFEAQVWNVKQMVTTEVDLTREWLEILSKLSTMPSLGIQPPLAVKEKGTCPVPCMIMRDNGTVCNFIGPSKDNNKPYQGFDLLTGDTFNFDADDLDKKLREENCPELAEFNNEHTTIRNTPLNLTTITRPINEIVEIIMVVLDTSGSMDNIYFANKTKYELAMTGFEQFCNRTTAYNFKNLIGLVIFGGESKLELELTESFRHFSSEIKAFPNKSKTALYDAIIFTIDYLNSFKSNHGFPNDMLTRIICLTDGEDNRSESSPSCTSSSLINNNIIMDSILLHHNTSETHGIAKLSGGHSFQPKDQKDLLMIFENETMLSLACRKHKCHLEITLREALLMPFDTQPEFLHPDKLTKTFQTSDKCLAKAVLHKTVSSQVSPEVTKRILKELAHLQTDPHPCFEVFPCSDAVDFWNLMLEAPKQTPYEGGVFRLYVEFTKDYPNNPPNIRFITPIYHCNINSAGRICHKVLDRFYSPEKKIKEILGHVYGLLLEATPDDPLDSYKADLLRTDKQEYDKQTRTFTQLHMREKTRTDIRIEILGCDPDIRSPHSKQLVCPLTLSLFKEPVMTIYGDTYEKEEIIHHIDVTGQDPFSFKSLRKDELYPNNNIKKGVLEFVSELQQFEMS